MKFIDRTSEAKKEMQKKALAALEDVGLHLEGEAMQEIENHPRRVDTGLLRNSITHTVSGKTLNKTYKADRPKSTKGQVVTGSYNGSMGTADELAVYIGTNVEYAIYVHEGTVNMEANRFLTNAVSKNEAQIKKWLNDEMKK